MCGQHKVGAALEHLELVVHRPWGAPEVRRGDHVEHGLCWRRDRARDRSERPDPAAEIEIDRERAADDQQVAAGRGGNYGHQSGDSTHGRSVGGDNTDIIAEHLRSAAQLYSPRRLTDGERWTAEALIELRRGGYRRAA